MKTLEQPDYYHIPAEKWDANKCAKMAKRIATDGLGTPYSFRGACPWIKSGPERYNGGTSHHVPGKWFPGVVHSLPELAEGFRWEYVPTWCWRIVATSEGN